ncbi:hypothetical protein Tco_0641420 [Tanacetum coccineum]
MSEFGDSSYHENTKRRILTPKEEASYPWEQHRSSDIDICRAFIKLCIVEDPIWEKISCELKEPICSTHVDECVCCQVQHMMEENMYALRKEMKSKQLLKQRAIAFTGVNKLIKAKEQLPIIVGYLLHCIESITPFNFAYFVAKCMNYLNDVAIPYARIITMLFEHINNQHPNDTSRMVEVDDIPPM